MNGISPGSEVGCISFCGAEDISLYIYMYRFAMEIAD
jgi:hypothetical protein